MLAGATRRIARNSLRVTLVARDLDRMQAIVPAAQHLALDYTHESEFGVAVEAAGSGSPFDLVVVWIHDSGDRALGRLDALVAAQRIPTRFVQVVGSRGASAPVPAAAGSSHVAYQRVLLGRVQEEDGERWLTHDEISDGVWRAIESGERRVVVGRLPG